MPYQIAQNPTTGERLININGAWKKIEQEAKNQEGQSAYRVDGSWVLQGPSNLAQTLSNDINKQVRSIQSGGQLGIDYKTGVPNLKLRYDLGRASSNEEKELVLKKYVGEGNYGQDERGRYFVKPEGLSKLGLPESQTPVSIQPAIKQGKDIAMDLSGQALPVAGAMVGGALAPPSLLATRGMLAAGLGGAAGQAYQELSKMQEGVHVGDAGETAGRIGMKGFQGAAGEGVARGLMGAGRLALGGYSPLIGADRKARILDAMDKGYAPTLQQTLGETGAMIQRQQGIAMQLFNNPALPKNAARAMEEMRDFMARSGSKIPEAEVKAIMYGEERPLTELGNAIKKNIVAAKDRFSQTAAAAYKRVDDAAKGPIIPTAPIKQAVAEISQRIGVSLKALPGETQAQLKFLSELPDTITASEAQFIRSDLRQSAESRALLKGVGEHYSGVLKNAVEESFTEAMKGGGAAAAAVRNLRAADRYYRMGAKKFDLPEVDRIVRDASYAGKVDPENVVNFIWQPKRPSALKRVLKLVNPETKEEIGAAVMRDLLTPLRKGEPGGAGSDFLLSGAPFRRRLDEVGREMLEVQFGKEMTDDLFKFADRMEFLTAQQTKAGSVAAPGLALHPINNAIKLAWIYSGGRIMSTPGFVKWIALGVGKGPKAMAAREALATMTRGMAQDTAQTKSNPAKATQAPVPPGSPLGDLEQQLIPQE